MYKTIEEYLPHRPPMILLDYVVDIGDEIVHCASYVNREGVLHHFLQDDGSLPSWYLIEIMAQTVGVWNGHCELVQNSVPRLGFLLGIRSFQSEITSIPYSSKLITVGKKVLQDDTIANFECHTILNDQIIAKGLLTVYGPTDEQIAEIFLEG